MYQLEVKNNYLILPLGFTAKNKKICFYYQNKLVLEFDVPIDQYQPDYCNYIDLSAFSGKELQVSVTPEMDICFQQTDEVPPKEFYHEKYRPSAHFSTKTGWINDPNGLVFDGKQFHMFYQHNPYSHIWSNMHWGHAVSTDLIHWREKDVALAPDELGTMFSGSAVIDRNNLTGLKENDNAVILLYYTAAGGSSLKSQGKHFTQCLAYSTDGGETFKKYSGNPIIEHIEAENRDPKVIYVPELSAYVMALYLNDNRYTLLISDDLIHWKFLQEISLPGDAECPDLYPLCLDSDPKKIRWIFSGASDRYLVGEFKSGKYRPIQSVQRLHYGNSSYAAQSFSDIPKEDGRRIRIAWDTVTVPNSYFGGSMCIPCEMNLQTIGSEETLTMWPVKEVYALFANEEQPVFENLNISKIMISKRRSGAHWLEFTIKPSEDSVFEFSLFGTSVEVSTAENSIKCMDKTMPVHIEGGNIHLLILADTMGLELFSDRGQSFMCMGFACDYNLNHLELHIKKGTIHSAHCRLAELKNIWT